MTTKRILVLMMSTTLGVLAFANPATATGPTFVDAWPQKFSSTTDLDADGDVDGRDFLIWQRHAG